MREGKIFMSCGCEETDDRPGSYVIYGSHDTFSDGSYGPCIAYAHMCQPCADRLSELGAPFFETEEQSDEWLRAQREAPNASSS